MRTWLLPVLILAAPALADEVEAPPAVEIRQEGPLHFEDIPPVDAELGAAWSTPARFRFGASSLLGNLVERLERF